jgi:cytosine/adenosine deaminase-related metal-dependent hydrolase/ubiquinone/menaquinone biosynthesis C-methylase UbiE
MASHSATTVLSAREGYRRWARSYDAAPNTMLSLERRYLEPLLPNIAGLDVIDLGCGTGRWLEILKDKSPGSLLGVDSSPEMLRQAKRKLKNAARFLNSDGSSVAFDAYAADLVLANFVLSYVEDAVAFLANARAALREGGSLFLTDLHPTTSSVLKWKRGVRSDSRFRQIRTIERSIETVIALCESAGLRLCARIEPEFGEAEKELFTRAGKLNYFAQCAEHPAICILQFRPACAPRAGIEITNADGTIQAIENASIALGPQERIFGRLSLFDSRIEMISGDPCHATSTTSADGTIDLKNYLLLPGLINAHDHLEFALFPRLGKGDYENSLEWAEDIHRTESAIIASHRQVPRETRLWWGGIRNLLCGVTTVSHHNPYEAGVFNSNFAVRVVRDYGWAHSLSLDADAANKKRQTPAGQPFLIHLAEGVDQGSEDEIIELLEAGALDKDTVLIHGLALTKKGRNLLRASGAGLIWCPGSNVFLFGRTLTATDIESLRHVALGSDSPLTAEGDLLDELRFALGISQLPLELLYSLVTNQPARLLKLREGQGSLRVGGVADIVAVRDRGESPANTLADLSYRDVELVVIGGRVQSASDELFWRLPGQARAGLQTLTIDGVVRWIRAPVDRLLRETSAHLPEGIRIGGKRVNVGIHH